MDNLISIIVPVYNAEKTLEKCVDSLVSQIHREIEIILVNDGSKDNSFTLCMKCAEKDGRIRVVDKPNGGVSSARNAGLDAATGDYVMFCDSDDWVEPDWCSTLYENRQYNGLAVCQVDDPNFESEVYPVEKELLARKDYMHRPMMMCSLCNKLFARDIIEQNKLRLVSELSLGEDFCFCLAYLVHAEGNICYVYQKLYHYLVTEDFSLTKSVPALEQCDLFFQELNESMRRIGIDDEQSISIRDVFVMSHFERFLAHTATRKDLSIQDKLCIAKKMEQMESVSTCCAKGVNWGNFLYIWFLRHKKVRLAMFFLILRSVRDYFRDTNKN